MTLIMSDGINVLADKRVHLDEVYEDWPDPKIKVVKGSSQRDGAVLGLAGTTSYQEVLFNWYEQYSCHPDHAPKNLNASFPWALIAFKTDAAYVWTHENIYPEKHYYPCAFGGGADGVEVALKAGMPLKKIHEIQSKRHNNCGETYDVARIPRPRR